MNDYASTEEVRAWYATRGFNVPTKGALGKRLIAGWNKAHPERPYVARRHGTTAMYTGFSCRCDECTAAASAAAVGYASARDEGDA
jgi:hypothetical protein